MENASEKYMTELATVLKIKSEVINQISYFNDMSNVDPNDYIDCSTTRESYKKLCDKIYLAGDIVTHLEVILDGIEQYEKLIED